jgi:hypothetical protein
VAEKGSRMLRRYPAASVFLGNSAGPSGTLPCRQPFSCAKFQVSFKYRDSIARTPCRTRAGQRCGVANQHIDLARANPLAAAFRKSASMLAPGRARGVPASPVAPSLAPVAVWVLVSWDGRAGRLTGRAPKALLLAGCHASPSRGHLGRRLKPAYIRVSASVMQPPHSLML